MAPAADAGAQVSSNFLLLCCHNNSPETGKVDNHAFEPGLFKPKTLLPEMQFSGRKQKGENG